MFNSTEGYVSAKESLKGLIGKFKLEKGTKVEAANDIFEKVLFALNQHESAPKYVVTRALYDKVETGVLSDAKFTVRPSSSHALEVNELKQTIVLNADEDFFDKFIDEMATWFDAYAYYATLQENVNKLNVEVAQLVVENELPFNVKFTLGEGIVDIDTTSVIVGISAEVIDSIPNMQLFDTMLETRVMNYKNTIVDTLRQCTAPYDIVKIKTIFTKDLGIYSRKATHKLIRKVVNRKAEHVRVGVGYYETESVFAVVEKIACTEEQAANAPEGIIVIDNKEVTSAEKKKGETKLMVAYRVAPYNKETGEPVTIDIATLL